MNNVKVLTRHEGRFGKTKARKVKTAVKTFTRQEVKTRSGRDGAEKEKKVKRRANEEAHRPRTSISVIIRWKKRAPSSAFRVENRHVTCTQSSKRGMLHGDT